MSQTQCTLELIKIILIEDFFIYIYFLYLKERVVSRACFIGSYKTSCVVFTTWSWLWAMNAIMLYKAKPSFDLFSSLDRLSQTDKLNL